MIEARRAISGWRPAFATAAAFAVTAVAGLQLGRETAGLAAVWVPNAFLLCALLLDARANAWRHAAGVALASIAVNLWWGNDAALTLVFTAANLATPIIAAALLRRMDVGADAFASPAGVGRVLVALAIAVPVGASAGAALIGARGGPMLDFWQSWASADLLGTLLMSALVLTLAHLRRRGPIASTRRAAMRSAWPLLIVLAVTVAVFAQTRFPLLFVPLAVLLIATFRLGVAGAVGGTMLVAMVGTVSLILDRGPIALVAGSLTLRMHFLQFYLATLIATCLPLASALAERRRLARERADSERQHRRIVERSREVIFETDVAGRWTYLNPAWTLLTGYDPADSLGRSFLALVDPADRAAALARLAPLYAREIDECAQELRFVHASGEMRWAAVRSHLLIGADGDAVGTQGSLHDITDRRRIEDALRESEQLYRLLAENSNDMIVRLDLNGVRNYVSPASVRLLGYEPHELIGRTPAGEIHPDDRPAVVATCRGLVEGAIDPICVYRQRRKDGSYTWLEATYRLIRDAEGAPFEAIASVRDVSRREVAELDSARAAAQLRESHRLLLMAEEMGQVGHWRLDIASQTVLWSDAVCAIHGLPPGHVPPLDTAIEAYHPGDRAQVQALVARALTLGEDFGHQARIVRPDGSVRQVVSRGRAERAPDGTIIGLFGVFQDVTDAHRATDALRESEARYKLLADHASDIVVRLGVADDFLFVSPSIVEVTGLSADAFLGQRLGAFVHDEDGDAVRLAVQRLHAAAGLSAIFEFRLRHRDGQWLWLEASLRSGADGASGGTHLIGSVRGIDRRKQAEVRAAEATLALSDSNRMLTMAEAVAHLGHWRVGTLDGEHFWSDEVYRIHGLAPGTPPTFELALASYHPDDAVRVRHTVEDAVAANRGYSFRARIFRPDGELVHIFIRGEIDRDAHGAVVGLFGIVQDVTDQARAEALLREREARFRLITDEASDMISLHDGDGRVLFMSPSVRAILGHAPEEMLGRTAADFAIPADYPVLRAHRRRLYEGRRGTAHSARFRMRRRDGSLVWMEVAARLADYDGRPCSIAVCRDIGDQVATEAALREARQEAEAAAAAKSSFLATMSHEIRTPMTGVLGMVELLRADADPAQRDRFFDTLEQSARTLMTVLDDVLDFSKIEAGNLALETIDFDLAALAHSVGDLFGSAASAKGLTLGVEAPAGGVPVRGDPTRIQQVLSNLVSNAIKFTERGGLTIAIAAGSAHDGGTRWRIAVADTGIGIDPAATDRLFNPFEQADPSTTRRFGGTGLGLAISRRLVEAMAGAIGAEARAGGGSCFWFDLPLADGDRALLAAPRIAAMPRPAGGQPLRVLVAEDNEINQLLLTALLRRLGHQPTCVGNGRLAVDHAGTGAFDVVLMDMQMPVMDGVAATHAIRALGGAFADLPIVALTADALPERRRFYHNIGLTDFLTKPIDVDRLAAVLDGVKAPPVLDPARLSELRAMLGEATVSELLAMIVREASTRPALIAARLADDDLATAAREAHGLYGAASNVGATRLAHAAATIQHADDRAAAFRDLAALDAAAAALVAALATAGAAAATAEGL